MQKMRVPTTDEGYLDDGSLIERILLAEPDGFDVEQGPQQLFRNFLDYYESTARLGKEPSEIDYLLRRFFAGNRDRRGLRLQFEPPELEVFGENWVTFDMKTVECGAREAGRVSFEFESEYFDMVLCTGLDRISRPASLVLELRRVLKRRGLIWAQAPFRKVDNWQESAAQQAYWRFTPEGFRVLFERFDEIMCSIYQSSRSMMRQESFFYGLKPEIASDNLDDPLTSGGFMLSL